MDSVHRPVSEMVSIGLTVQTGGTDRAVHFLIIIGLRDKARGVIFNSGQHHTGIRIDKSGGEATMPPSSTWSKINGSCPS